MKVRKFKFQKLVRDNLASLMEEKGSVVHSKVLSTSEYIKALEEKLIEEAEEMVLTDNSDKGLIAEEIADIYEVLNALIQVLELNPEEVENARIKKMKERGGFEKRIYFDYVEVSENDPDCEYLSSLPERYPEF